jgi:formylglycine-generating enzyme required for sulfatase activity
MTRSITLVFLFLPFIICSGLSIAQSETEPSNSVGMRFALIRKGIFIMGAPKGEPFQHVNDQTQHEVRITKDFYMGSMEVTQEQFQTVMGKNPSRFPGEKVKGDISDYPVDNVTWEDAVEFCRRLTEIPEEKSAGYAYRLPTEAEWEYACRAGSTTAFFSDERSASLADFAWYRSNSNGHTHPVGSKKPNPWGLYDVHGNVSEWVSDWWAKYPTDPQTDPKGPRMGWDRVHRGGSCCVSDIACKSALRRVGPPLFYPVGFRIVLQPTSRNR